MLNLWNDSSVLLSKIAQYSSPKGWFGGRSSGDGFPVTDPTIRFIIVPDRDEEGIPDLYVPVPSSGDDRLRSTPSVAAADKININGM